MDIFAIPLLFNLQILITFNKILYEMTDCILNIKETKLF